MKRKMHPQAKVHMQRRALQRMTRVRRGTILSCDAGALWITQSGDHKDHILLSGDTMVVAKRGPVLVQAMRDAAFHVA